MIVTGLGRLKVVGICAGLVDSSAAAHLQLFLPEVSRRAALAAIADLRLAA